MPKLCITVDLDRDANIPLPGSREAGSLDRGEGTSPRFDAAGRGLVLLSELFDEMGLPATFFAECQTLEMLHDIHGYLDGFEVGVHGYSHEDFSLLDKDSIASVLETACDTYRDILDGSPSVFRAPYMKTCPELLDILPEYGLKIDSSLYSPADSCSPYGLSARLTEVPVLRDPGTGRTSYLWPVHEGNRDYPSFLELAESVGENGTFVLCDHSWHICESRVGGKRSEGDAANSVRGLRQLLEDLLDRGFRAVTVSGAVGL